VLGALLWMTTHAAAQDGIIDEANFWYRLDLTDVLLAESSGETITQVNNLWRDVDRVRLPDGTVIGVNVAWLQVNSDSSPDDLRQVHARVRAILAYHEISLGNDAQSAAQLDALDAIFRRDEVSQAGESRPRRDNSSGGKLLAPSTAHMILIAFGVIVVLGLLVYLGRMLQVQPAAVDLDTEVIPASSQAATDKAEELKAVQDYRAAIRQLYLASLLVLDEQGIIRFDAALTNREHLDQLREQPRLRELMTQVVTIFDHVWYGFAPADEALYRSFRHYLDQLRQGGQ
jgi:hypothetical protein